MWRLHNLGWRCQVVPLVWEKRSLLNGIRHGAADSSCIKYYNILGNHVWFCQSGAIKTTSLTRMMTWGNRSIGGKAYRQALGQSWARASCPFEKNVGQWELSSEAKRLTSALPKISQIIWTIWGWILHSPGDTLPQDSMSAPWFSLPGMWTAPSEHRLHCAHNRKLLVIL